MSQIGEEEVCDLQCYPTLSILMMNSWGGGEQITRVEVTTKLVTCRDIYTHNVHGEDRLGSSRIQHWTWDCVVVQ